MRSHPLISIVTPSFNRGWSIRSCIESLQNQTYIDYEHIIVDGGSTDNTLEILQEVSLADSRVKYITESDCGMYDAVNKGMRMATANIVAYLNTDDFYLPNTLENVIRTLEANPNLSMVYGHWMSWHPETNFLEILPVLNYTSSDLAAFAVLPQPSVFFRREVFESFGGFDLSFKLLADNDFFSKAAVKGFKFKRIDDYLSIQTVHSGNLLAGNSEAIFRAKVEADRYRSKRKQELFQSNSKVCDVRNTAVKKTFLPVVWRIDLIFRWFYKSKNSAEFRSEIISSKYCDFSLYLFIKYLLGRGDRYKFAFNKIDHAKLSNYLNFPVPIVTNFPDH
jgi:glycosyltransferase involved in cell wall biosynthesis